jgi:hypothetical protein
MLLSYFGPKKSSSSASSTGVDNIDALDMYSCSDEQLSGRSYRILGTCRLIALPVLFKEYDEVAVALVVVETLLLFV